MLRYAGPLHLEARGTSRRQSWLFASRQVLKAEVGFRLHAAKLTSLACNGARAYEEFLSDPLLADNLLDWITSI
jgi:hypothetical protein